MNRESVGWPTYILLQAGLWAFQAWMLMLVVGLLFSNGILGGTISYAEAIFGSALLDLVIMPSIYGREVKP